MGLHQSALSLNITVAALAGAMLAGNEPFLATLPLAMSFVLLMVASAPVSFLLERIGWKSGFGVGALAGMVGCLLSALAMVEQSFILFCIALSILGVATAIGNYYRFAAAETQPPERRATAVSTVLTGGIAAAILGPLLAVKGSDLFVYSFAGSYLIMTGLYLAIVPLLVLVGFPSGERTRSATPDGAAGRKLSAIARQPIFLLAAIGAMLGYGAMNLIMVSTPTAMVGCGFVMADAGSVIHHGGLRHNQSDRTRLCELPKRAGPFGFGLEFPLCRRVGPGDRILPPGRTDADPGPQRVPGDR